MERGRGLFLLKRKSSARATPRNRSPLGPARWQRHLPSRVRCLFLGWGVRYSRFSGTKYSEDLVVAHTTPINPFRPQWVAVSAREDTP